MFFGEKADFVPCD